MTKTWVNRLKSATAEKGWTLAELARRSGVSKDSVDKYAQGRVENPRGATLKRLATALGVSESWLKFGESEIQETQTAFTAPKFLAVLGAVQGGAFVEAVPYHDELILPVAESPDYEGTNQFLLEVMGPSMNLEYLAGSFVHCVQFEYQDTLTPEHGDHVIVERRRAGMREVTIKEYVLTESGPELWPRSSDQNWQEPVRLYDAPDIDEVVITALVIGSYRKR